MKSGTLLVFCIVAATCTSVASADWDFDPTPVIDGRQSGLRDIGAAFKGIGDELRKPTPSLALIRQYAKQIDDLARQQELWFPPGTGPETELDTAAKPEIWQRPAEFQSGQAAMSEHAARLAQVSTAEDVNAVRKQWQALGRTCKACHDKFREERD